ncbi:MAG: HlyD family efflux transporter periplasmic adaptor subunit [Anaerolineales bacterium]|nr:HlyD family efflux transporter periplasmic adaptor subunit [Anaerolineales bacterium]
MLTISRLFSLLMPAALLAACAGAATPAPATVPVVVDDLAVVADGRLEPAQSLPLAFLAGGPVAQVFAAEGDTVAAGDVLAVLDNTEALQSQVAAAESQRANLALEQSAAALERLSAEQALADLNDSAAIVTAQAAFAVAQAHDALLKADRDLKNVQNPVSERLTDAVADAALALQNAQAGQQLANVSPEQQAHALAVANTDAAWRAYQDLQAKYDDSNGNLELLDAVKRAQAAYQSALDAQLALELQISTAATNQADAVAKAQEAYDDAQANLAAAQRGPDADKLALAQANQALAAANLADAQRRLALVANGPNADQVALAQARLATAEARVVAAEAAIPAAEAALAAAQAALENVELRAPFAGTLAAFDLQVGQQVAPGQSLGTLADFTRWTVATNNLTEIDVVRIQAGQAVTVVLDALPDHPLRGTVTAIDSVFAEQQGDITYTAEITLTDTHPLMRWGMTAAVTFEK